MGRGKIERETKGEKKKRFLLGRNARRRVATRIATKEKRESSQEREVCVENKT